MLVSQGGTKPKVAMLAAIFALCATSISAQNNITGPMYGPTNDTWNYANSGSDWTYTTCALDQYVQAPIDITNTADTNNTFTGEVSIRWADNGYSFLPDFVTGTATWYGFEQYVYQLFGSFGGVYLSEPAVNPTSNHIVYYDASNIRFHYPSEHTLNGTAYALEMQIFGFDTFERNLGCFSNHSAVSILFNLDASAPDQDFFSWQADATAKNTVSLDISGYLSKISGTTSSVSGYMGTDTMPGCTYGTCWYILNEVQTINQSQLDFFKVDGLVSNARAVGLSASTSWTQSFYNYGLFAPSA